MVVGDVIEYLERAAPPETAQEWDHVGLQLGATDRDVSRVMVCLEVTETVVAEAAEAGAELIVAHHPLIFRTLAAVRTDRPLGRLIARLLREDIAVYASHTNLDAAAGIGTAAVLADLLELSGVSPLMQERESGLGAIGELASETGLCALAEVVRERLEPARLVVLGDEERAVRRVAVMPGSGGDAVGPAAEAGADVLVCGDLNHHDALDALALGLAVIDATHYATERPVVESVVRYLRAVLAGEVDVQASQVVTDPFAAAPCRAEARAGRRSAEADCIPE